MKQKCDRHLRQKITAKNRRCTVTGTIYNSLSAKQSSDDEAAEVHAFFLPKIIYSDDDNDDDGDDDDVNLDVQYSQEDPDHNTVPNNTVDGTRRRKNASAESSETSTQSNYKRNGKNANSSTMTKITTARRRQRPKTQPLEIGAVSKSGVKKTKPIQ